MPDAGKEILEAMIGINLRGRSHHGADSAAHVPICDVAKDVWRNLFSSRTSDPDAGVSDMMHNVIRDDATADSLHRWEAGGGV